MLGANHDVSATVTISNSRENTEQVTCIVFATYNLFTISTGAVIRRDSKTYSTRIGAGHGLKGDREKTLSSPIRSSVPNCSGEYNLCSKSHFPEYSQLAFLFMYPAKLYIHT